MMVNSRAGSVDGDVVDGVHVIPSVSRNSELEDDKNL